MQKGNNNADDGTKKKKSSKRVESGHKKEVVDMGRLFVKQYFKLHRNFNGILNYTLSPGFSGSGLIRMRGVPLFLIDL